MNTKQDSINSSSENNFNIYVKQNFFKYSEIYNTINDSINCYLDSGLANFKFIYKYEWRVDSLLCINNRGDKLVTTINKSNGVGKNGVSDVVSGLLGKKINGIWYFFKGGGTLIVPRDMYGKDAMHPLSFYELSQIARKNYLSGAIIKNNKGELIINDKWVDDYFYNNGFAQRGWSEIKDRPKYDSVHWFYIMDKWKHKIDTNEYKPLQRKQFKKVNS
ncbi:MAG: hypothetical protein V4667_08355 [Bacteroidota bacterium]